MNAPKTPTLISPSNQMVQNNQQQNVKKEGYHLPYQQPQTHGYAPVVMKQPMPYSSNQMAINTNVFPAVGHQLPQQPIHGQVYQAHNQPYCNPNGAAVVSTTTPYATKS